MEGVKLASQSVLAQFAYSIIKTCVMCKDNTELKKTKLSLLSAFPLSSETIHGS